MRGVFFGTVVPLSDIKKAAPEEISSGAAFYMAPMSYSSKPSDWSLVFSRYGMSAP